MLEKEIDLRKLVIKAFHINEVKWGEANRVTSDGHMTIAREAVAGLLQNEEYIESVEVRIIKPEERDVWTNTIMDIIPISTKVLGVLGEGITHTLTGVYVILTGVDTNGKQCHEFGSSEGILKDQMVSGRAGLYHIF